MVYQELMVRTHGKRKRNNWGFLETDVERGSRLCRSLLPWV